MNFNKTRVLIWGFGREGKRLLMQIANEFDYASKFVGFVDSFAPFWGKRYMGLPIYSPKQIKEIEFDYIVIATTVEKFRKEIYEQIISYGIDEDCILDMHKEEVLGTDIEHTCRYAWLKGFAAYVYKENIQGNVAECGVFRGDYSKFLNEFFPDRKLYLFDTFEGFDEKDLEVERSIGNERFINGMFNNREVFDCTNVEMVLDKMGNRNNVCVKKGCFPETTKGFDDKFCFVQLDMDLYQPMYSGLEFFYDRMCMGGVIMIHDYLPEDLTGVRKAINDYENNKGIILPKLPIGDDCSIAIIKNQN